MRVGLIQSNYIPWRGYFDFIDDVDLFIFFDDVQYTSRDWRNRNVIKTPTGKKWITVPVQHSEKTQLISDVLIDYSRDWISTHIDNFRVSYAKTPHVHDARKIFDNNLKIQIPSISELNIRIIRDICDYLKIDTPLEVASKYSADGTKTDRIIDIMNKVGATVYLSGPNADGYLDKELFRENHISLEYKSYAYDPYPQPWGDFIGDVTILDLIANCGPDARQFLKSTEKNRVIIP